MSGKIDGGIPAEDFGKAVTAKCMLRIVGFLSVLFFMAWIDRVNVGFAALQMNGDLGFSATVYGLGAGLFFVGYTIFEVPSNLVLSQVGARLWIARIMVTWGIISSCFAFIHGETSFYILRFLLGAAEAGFVPGVVLFLSQWFPRQNRARAFSIFFSCALLAPMVGGPLSGWLMSSAHGIGGFPGWRFMFLVEGVPAVILGVITVFYLPDTPERASWLTADERLWIRSQFEEEAGGKADIAHGSALHVFRDPMLWAFMATYYFWAISGYGIIYWLPIILKSMGSLSNLAVGCLSALPFVFGIAGLLLASYLSDRSGDRKSYLVVLSIIGGAALAASGFTSSIGVALGLICVSAFGIWGAQAIFWTIPAAYLKHGAAAAGIAMVNMAAGLGGFTGPYLVGWVKDTTGEFSLSLVALAATSFIMAGIVMVLPIARSARRSPGRVQLSAG
jgi:D-galactonate transporter